MKAERFCDAKHRKGGWRLYAITSFGADVEEMLYEWRKSTLMDQADLHLV
ncbi:MAG: hypothetical protein ACI9FD_002162 [Gammaproteobacteria bacterium]|jgi:hypothetical protein